MSNRDAALKILADGLAATLAGVQKLLSERDPDEWVSQKDSPLGRRRHCRLVRAGKLKGFRVERDVFVRRSDIEAYIQQHPIEPKDPNAAPDEGEASRVAAILKEAQERGGMTPRKRRRAA